LHLNFRPQLNLLLTYGERLFHKQVCDVTLEQHASDV